MTFNSCVKIDLTENSFRNLSYTVVSIVDITQGF